MNRKRLIAMGIIMTLSMSTVACGKKEEKTEISKVAVEVENPTTGELTNDTTYIGTVEPQQQVYVTPKVSGTVTAAYFEVGDTVKEGDVLFKIDDEAAQLQMKSAEASYSQAEAGVTAATSGSRDLQNYQTEEQIRQLKEKLSAVMQEKRTLMHIIKDSEETMKVRELSKVIDKYEDKKKIVQNDNKMEVRR